MAQTKKFPQQDRNDQRLLTSYQAMPPSSLDLSLKRFRIIPPTAVQKMKQSLSIVGQMSPLIVASQQRGHYVLIDGFKRQQAAVQIGWKTVSVDVVPLSQQQMIAQVYLRNQNAGLSYLEECLIISELYRLQGMNQVAIGKLFKKHRSWVCRRLQCIERISPQILEQVKLGLIHPGAAQKLTLLPRGNQEDLAAVVQTADLTVRQTEHLVRLYGQAKTPEARRFVLTKPRQTLKHALASVQSHETPLSSQLMKILQLLHVVRQISIKGKEIIDHELIITDPTHLKLLKQEWEKVLTALGELQETIAKEENDDEANQAK